MDERTPLLSVIIPIYNTENHIQKCLDSIFNQTFQDFELLLINDGSTDNSLAICQQYQENYPNQIIVVDNQHQGQGICRNIGMSFAKGDYISFIDSDDYIHEDMYQIMLSKIVQTDCDIVICDMTLIDNIKNQEIIQLSVNDKVFHIAEYIQYGVNICSPCNKIFKKTILDGYQFKSIFFEDAALIPAIISYCNKIEYIRQPLYYYCLRAHSTSTSVLNPQTLDIIKAMREVIAISNPKYHQEMVYAQAACILFCLNSERKIYISEFVQFIQELKEEFQNNPLILEDESVCKILDYIDTPVIPNHLVYANFGDPIKSSSRETCFESWEKFAIGFQFVELNEENCRLSEAPQSVQKAYHNQNYQFVNDYFKLEYLYHHGGIAVDFDLLLLSPLNPILLNSCFFAFQNSEQLLTNVFGSLAQNELLHDILKSYTFSNFSGYEFHQELKDNQLPLSTKLETILSSEKYQLIRNGKLQTLPSQITIYPADVFSSPIPSETQIAKFYPEYSRLLEQNNLQVIDKSLLEEFYLEYNQLKEQEHQRQLRLHPPKLETPTELPSKHVTKQEKTSYPYKFSIIMSVYEVELFIDEAIESILNQDIGFKHIQLILVDDGSPDSSGAICDRYAQKYPNNIVVIHKENGGLSSARNTGLKHIQGKYVNFMDPDDKLSLDTLSKVYLFFEAHYSLTDVVAIPLIFFDARTDEHPSNKMKFNKGNRIIDLTKEYFVLHTSCAASFIKNSVAKTMSFDEQLHSMEDAKALLSIYLKNPTLGVVRDCIYHYRKRTNGPPSLSQGASKLSRWYTDFLHRFSEWCIHHCLEFQNTVPLFVQYTIMYDFQWRLSQQHIPENILTDAQIQEYKSLLFSLLEYIDDKIILEQKNIWTEHKIFALCKKYHKRIETRILPDSIMYRHNNTNIANLSQVATTIEFITYQDNVLTIEGKTLCFDTSEDEEILVYAKVNQKQHYLANQINRNINRYCLDEILYRGIAFQIHIPIDDSIELYTIDLFMVYREHNVARKKLIFDRFAPIGNRYENSYFYKNARVLTVEGSTFHFKKCGRKGWIEHEKKFLEELQNSKVKSDQEAAKLRKQYFYHLLINKLFKKKPIWLVSDKATRGDDNGEAMFRFLNTKKIKKNVDSYFVVSESFSKLEEIQKVGKTVNNLSEKHKLLFLLAHNNLSAYTHAGMLNPFLGRYEPYRDIMQNCDFVFLQHGITHNDVSEGLNRFNKNIKLLTAAASDEYDYFQTERFHYEHNEIVLTGFARYDLLYNQPKKIITIAPTWRQELFSDFIPKEDRWNLLEGFENSEYFQFFSQLVNNDRLLTIAQANGYRIHFLPHSVFFPYIDRFQVDSRVMLSGSEISYREVFATSNLLVSDYSSVIFDFAYLRKPVIYTQFDKTAFYETHGYKPGYFDYEANGFGEVEYTLENTINRIIEYIEHDCQLKPQYLKRIDRFFQFQDKNNCQRIYEAIVEKDKEKKFSKK